MPTTAWAGCSKPRGPPSKTWSSVNIFYRYDGPQESIGAYTDQIHAVSAEYLKAPHPTGSTIRVNGLAYEGLLVEIEAIAAVGGNNRPVEPAMRGGGPAQGPSRREWSRGA